MKRFLWFLSLTVCLSAADYQAPAGEQAANPRPGAISVLPGGRMIDAYGRQFATGPAPFGLAVDAEGRQIVTANGGPDEFSLTVLEQDDQRRFSGRQIVAPRPDDEESDENVWRGVSTGLAHVGRNEVLFSEGDTGRVLLVRLRRDEVNIELTFDLNGGGARDSYSGALAYDSARGIAYVADQANSKLVVLDLRAKRVAATIPVGLLPYAVELSPDGRRVYVANVGMFAYQPVPGASVSLARATGLSFPAFGFPSSEASNGASRATADGDASVPGLGDPNSERANSLYVIDVENPREPTLVGRVRTGRSVSDETPGGSSPSGIAVGSRIYVANALQDSITVIDPTTLAVIREIPLRIPGLEEFRGVMPAGMDIHRGSGWLLVAEAGINAVAVIDTATDQLLGHIPAAWYPTGVKVHEDDVYVTNIRGHGTGATANRMIAIRERLGRGRGGVVSVFPLPARRDLAGFTARVMELNGFTPQDDESSSTYPAGEIRHVVLVVKQGRTYDEVLGDIGTVGVHEAEGASMLAMYGRFGSARATVGGFSSRYILRNVNVTPNHHAIATRWAFSDNFYSDASTSVGGHHWLAGAPPNPWTLSSLMAAYGGAKDFLLETPAEGRRAFAGTRTSVHPEEVPELGTLWHHLVRHGISFRSFGEGFDLAGAQTGLSMEPTGTRLLTNVPMPEPLYQNTSREYPGANLAIPDQVRADEFIREIKAQYLEPERELPDFLYIHLPNDGMGDARPVDGYPFAASFVADNDYALGRIVEFLSNTPYWKHLLILVTEDAAQDGPDHVNANRVPFLAAGPWVRRGYISHRNVSFPGLQKTIFRVLGIPPLNLFDAAATDLSDLFADEPDYTPYEVQAIPEELFVPERARPAAVRR